MAGVTGVQDMAREVRAGGETDSWRVGGLFNAVVGA